MLRQIIKCKRLPLCECRHFTESLGGESLVFQVGYHPLIIGISKHNLSMLFPGMKIDHKYAFCYFLYACSLIFPSMPIPKFVNMSKKQTLFLQFHINSACFVPLDDVHIYIVWSRIQT